MPSKDTTPTCSKPDCDKRAMGRGLCSAHYHAALMAEPRPNCAVDGCDQPARTKKLCNAHYTQAGRTGGDPTAHLPRRQRKMCTVPDCGEKAVAFGLCFLHDQRMKRSGTTDAPGPRPRNTETCQQCGVEFAAKASKQRQFCSWTCADKAKRSPDRTCATCGKDFHVSPAVIDRGAGKYCSAACFGIAHRGPEFCSVEGCGRKHLANGFCRRHDPKSQEAQRRGNRKWRARKYDAFMATIVRQEIYERDNGTCYLCGEAVDLTLQGGTKWTATLDHIIPLAIGGTDEPANVRLAHKGCNSKKGIRYDGPLPPPKDARPRPVGHPRSKLTDEQAREAYERCAAGERYDLVAHDFGVHPAVIGALCRGTRRQHLKLAPLGYRRTPTDGG